MLLGFMAVCGTTAWAQTDVTAQYLTNADFSSTEGWTEVLSGEYRDFGNGLIGEYTVRFSPATVDETHLATEYCFGFECRWSTNYSSCTQTTKELPAGIYKLEYDVENVNGSTSAANYENRFTVTIGETAIEDASTEWMKAKSSWTTHMIKFTLTEATAATISLGYGTGSNNTSANNTPAIYVSHLKLKYYESESALLQEEMQEEIAEAQALLADDTYAAITGEERSALQTAANGTDLEALKTAIATFKAAKADYDAFKAAQELASTIDLPYALPSKKPAVANMAPTNAADAKEKATGIYTSLRAYYESNALAENEADAINMTEKIQNPDATDGNNGWTWTGNKNNPRNNESWTDANGKNDYMYFDGGDWGSTGWTTTMSQKLTLPAGKYLLTAKGRAAENVTLTMAVGEATVELPHVGNAGNVFDRGWNDGYVVFSNPDGEEVEILIKATTAGQYEWFSVGDFRLMQLEEFSVEMAGEAEIQALDQKAFAVAVTHEEGFAAGQYAPYTNVEAFVALNKVAALLERAKQGEELTKTIVEEASASLDALVWTANTEEMNAIFDGQFATTEANTTSGDINLPGWTKVQGIRLLVKDEAKDPGLAYTDGKAALFAWGGTTLTYGEQEGYTLPLDIDKPYKLSMKVSGWRDGDLPNDIRVNLSGCEEKVINDASVGRVNAAEGNPFAQLEIAFKGFTARPKLTIFANHHFTIADLELKSISEEEYEVVVGISEVATQQTAEQAIFNLAGQRVAKAQKGLYIINGKKMVVK